MEVKVRRMPDTGPNSVYLSCPECGRSSAWIRHYDPETDEVSVACERGSCLAIELLPRSKYLDVSWIPIKIQVKIQ